MRFLERTAEKLQLENDNLKAELVERDQKYHELMCDFHMTEDFRMQVEEENTKLKAEITSLKDELSDQEEVTKIYYEQVKKLEQENVRLTNENDRLEAKNYDLKCNLVEAKTDLAGLQLNSNTQVIRNLVQSLKAAGIIPQQTEVKI